MFWVNLGIGILICVILLFVWVLCRASSLADDHANKLYQPNDRGDNDGNNQNLH